MASIFDTKNFFDESEPKSKKWDFLKIIKDYMVYESSGIKTTLKISRK